MDGRGSAGELSGAVQAELRTTALAGFGGAGAADVGQVTQAVIMEAVAQEENNQVVISTLLLQRATQLAIGTKLRSLSRATSALNNWHMFAVGFLNDRQNGVVQLAQDDKATAVLAPLLLTVWAFLTRMHSECVPLEWGSLEELLTIPDASSTRKGNLRYSYVEEEESAGHQVDCSGGFVHARALSNLHCVWSTDVQVGSRPSASSLEEMAVGHQPYSRRRRRCRCSEGASCFSATRRSTPVRGSG